MIVEGKGQLLKIDWKEKLIDSAQFNKHQDNQLKNGAKPFTHSWLLGVVFYIHPGTS